MNPQRLHEISADRKAQFQALAREMALHDEATLREDAEIRGVARILRHQLKTKFGELPSAVEQHIQLADSVQLER